MVPYLSTVSVAVAPESEGQVEVSFREARPSAPVAKKGKAKKSTARRPGKKGATKTKAR